MTDRASAEGLRAARIALNVALGRLDSRMAANGNMPVVLRQRLIEDINAALAALRDHSDSGDIDVERLGRALTEHSADVNAEHGYVDHCGPVCVGPIAREYARTSTPRTESPE